jgi:hypothetical protein
VEVKTTLPRVPRRCGGGGRRPELVAFVVRLLLLVAVPIRIETLAEATARKREQQFCYLCGVRLPERGIEWTKRVDDEHIVPRSMRGDSRTNAAWSPILPVHRECNDRKNRGGDEVAALLHKMRTESPAEWPPQIKSLHLKPFFGHDEVAGRPRPNYGFRGALGIRRAAMNWARGFHTFLYGQFLPDPTKLLPAVIGTPFAESVNGHPAARIEQHKACLRGVIDFAGRTGLFDGVKAWDDQVSYLCTWLPPRRGRPLRQCVWALQTPGIQRYRDGTGFEGWWPWMGMYSVVHPPERRQALPSDCWGRMQLIGPDI